MKFLYLSMDQIISDKVAAFVSDMVGRAGSSVTLFVVIDHEKHRKKMQERILKIEKKMKSPLEIKMETGDPIPLILDEIETGDYDIAVLGIRQRRRLVPSAYRLLSQKVIKHSPIPIMLVRDANQKLERILICTGGQEISEPVVKLSANLAREANLKATLMYVSGAVPSMYTGMGEIEERLDDILETDTPLAKHLRMSAEMLAKNNIEAQVEFRHGDVAENIILEAQNGDYDLVVLGTSGSNTFAGMLLGNVTQQVVNRAGCAVLIVK
ncbi:MAG: universal stress protein [Anaerolineales bacterium]|jgi:nucleotide-binding universal stress UspA family protein